MIDTQAYFDDLYRETADPYSVRSRWYEQRKRAVLLASLPKQRYARAFEPGCGAAELTVALAARCDQVLASDFADNAVAGARERTAELDNVDVEKHILPDDWPHARGAFDLIVVSEIGYFLDAQAVQRLADCCAQSLAADGTLVACDWRPDFAERSTRTDDLHAALARIGLPRLLRHDESDFLLQVWCRDPRSVAQRDGIR